MAEMGAKLSAREEADAEHYQAPEQDEVLSSPEALVGRAVGANELATHGATSWQRTKGGTHYTVAWPSCSSACLMYRREAVSSRQNEVVEAAKQVKYNRAGRWVDKESVRRSCPPSTVSEWKTRELLNLHAGPASDSVPDPSAGCGL